MNYENFIKRVNQGCSYRIDLTKRELRINNKITNFDSFIGNWQTAEELYQKFKHSAPCERNNGNTPYFKALGFEELSDDELAFNENRNVAQAMLEGYLLMAVMEWRNGKQWYRKGADTDFIVLREWIKEQV